MENDFENPVLNAPELEIIHQDYDALQEVRARLNQNEFEDRDEKGKALYQRIKLEKKVNELAYRPTVIERVESMAQYITREVVALEGAAQSLSGKSEREKQRKLERAAMFRERLGGVALYYQRFGEEIEAPKALVEKVYELAAPQEESENNENLPKEILHVSLSASAVSLNGNIKGFHGTSWNARGDRAKLRKDTIEFFLTGEGLEGEYTGRELWEAIRPGTEYDQHEIKVLRQWIDSIKVGKENLLVTNGKKGRASKTRLNPRFEVRFEEPKNERESTQEAEEEIAPEIVLTDNLSDYLADLFVMATHMEFYTQLFDHYEKPSVDHRTTQALSEKIDDLVYHSEDELIAHRQYAFEKFEKLFADREAYYALLNNSDLDHPAVEVLALLEPHFRTKQDAFFLKQALSSTRHEREESTAGHSTRIIEFLAEDGHTILSLESKTSL